MTRRNPLTSALLATLLFASVAAAQASGGLTGVVTPNQDDCVPAADRAMIQAQVDAFRALHGEPEGPGVPPTFSLYPQGASLWQDLSIGNFVDLDPTGGVLAWTCTPRAANGHAGDDSQLRSFGEQVIGVPVFAAADGVVSATQDGYPDMNTVPMGQPGNYVIVSHAGGRDTWYLHLKNGSVAVTVGQVVKAGQQVGLTASSGNSGGPHLHFETRDAGVPKEPWAGPCRAGESLFTIQPAHVGSLFLGDFAFSRVVPSTSPWPFASPRTSNFASTDDPIYFWTLVHNLPASSTYTVRWKRPNGTLYYGSGPWPIGNPEWSFAWIWFTWSVPEMATTPGTWTLEFDLNGSQIIAAPFDVFAAYNPAYNRAPAPVTVTLDPAAPGAGDVITCRVLGPSVLDDLDWDIVRYQYTWKVDGATVRTLTSAGRSDALPHHLAAVGQTVSCEVTPSDGLLTAPIASAATTIHALASDKPTISLSAGGLITLSLDLGPSYAGQVFATVGSITGTSPGITVAPGVVVPLVYDSWLDSMITTPNAPPYTNAIGTLDSQGIGKTTITVPAGLPLGLAGAMIWHASLAFGSPMVASNAVVLTAVL